MSAAKKAPWDPACGKEFPAGDKTGHCGTCCETFYGLAAFELHRQGEHGVDRHCIIPGDVGGLWWADDRKRWHYGERLAPEALARLVGSRGAAE